MFRITPDNAIHASDGSIKICNQYSQTHTITVPSNIVLGAYYFYFANNSDGIFVEYAKNPNFLFTITFEITGENSTLALTSNGYSLFYLYENKIATTDIQVSNNTRYTLALIQNNNAGNVYLYNHNTRTYQSAPMINVVSADGLTITGKMAKVFDMSFDSNEKYNTSKADLVLKTRLQFYKGKGNPVGIAIHGEWQNIQYANENVDTSGLKYVMVFDTGYTERIIPDAVSPSKWKPVSGSQALSIEYTKDSVKYTASKNANVKLKQVDDNLFLFGAYSSGQTQTNVIL